MAFVAGHNSYFLVDAVDWSSYMDSQSIDRARDMLDTTVFGLTDKTQIAGLRSHSISVSGNWDATHDAAAVACDDGEVVAFEFGPEGSTAGNVKYSGNCWITDYGQSSSVSDKVTWSASFTPDGAVTRGTF